MENFKHSEKAEELQGFERRFYDAIVWIGRMICESTGAKPGEVMFEKNKKNILVVTAIIKGRGAQVSVASIQNYTNQLAKHFPVFFTPAHYRPYEALTAVGSTGGKIELIGTYSGGE